MTTTEMIINLIINLFWMGTLTGTVYIVTNRIVQIQKEKNNLAELVECMQFDYLKVHDLIDNIINEVGSLYKIQQLTYDAYGNVIFNKDSIKDMMEFMLRESVYYITPSIENILRTIVNIETQEDLIFFLNKKIKIYVLNYSLEVRKEHTNKVDEQLYS